MAHIIDEGPALKLLQLSHLHLNHSWSYRCRIQKVSANLEAFAVIYEMKNILRISHSEFQRKAEVEWLEIGHTAFVDPCARIQDALTDDDKPQRCCPISFGPKVLAPSAYAVSETLSVKHDGTKMDNCFSFRVGERLVELCMSVEHLPGAFERTRLVTLRNRYCIVNAMADDALLVRQEGTPEASNYVLEVPPLGKAFFHWSAPSGAGPGSSGCPQRLLVRFKRSSRWSLGGFRIDAVGGVGVWGMG